MLRVMLALTGAQGKGKAGKDESRKSQKTQCVLVISKLEKCQELETPLDRANFRT